MHVPNRRSMVVLASLVGAMTVASGVLLLLEPRQAVAVRQLSLLSVDRANPSGSGDDFILDPVQQSPGDRWSAIVVRYGKGPLAIETGTRRLGADDHGYHFVVPIAQSKSDRQVKVGYRWRHQLAGAYWAGPESAWVNHHAIGVCVINEGDRGERMEERLNKLVLLVQQLQTNFKIPADRVILEVESGAGSSKGRWFPVAWFRQQLLSFSIP